MEPMAGDSPCRVDGLSGHVEGSQAASSRSWECPPSDSRQESQVLQSYSYKEVNSAGQPEWAWKWILS